MEMKTLRGLPRLNLELEQIVQAIRLHQQLMAAARDLGCSDAYIDVRLRKAGPNLARVLESPDLESLLHGHQ